MTVAALILAAGASRRFGGAKLAASWRGEPLLARAVRLARSVLPGQVHVVLGAHRNVLEPLCGDARVLVNEGWRSGLASSLAVGIKALPGNVDAVLVMLADQPALTATDLRTLLVAGARSGMACARYGDTLGVPALFPRALFPRLLELEGDRGAKALLAEHRGQLEAVDMPAASADVDTVADLQNLPDPL